MSLNKKYTCTCKVIPNYLESHGYRICPWCLNKGFRVFSIDLEKYIGEFSKAIIWPDIPDGKRDIKEYRDDIWAEITCECGDEVHFSEWGKQVCKCGRVYRFSGEIEKDDSHLGDFEYWKREWEMFEGEPE